MAQPPPVPEPLAKLLATCCDVNAPELLGRLRERVATGEAPSGCVEPVRAALREAIANQGVTPAQYEALTGDDEHETLEAVTARLKDIHDTLFGVKTA